MADIVALRLLGVHRVDPQGGSAWSLTSLGEIAAKVVGHGRYVTFQMAEVAVPKQMFREILSLIARLRAPPAPARPADGRRRRQRCSSMKAEQ